MLISWYLFSCFEFKKIPFETPNYSSLSGWQVCAQQPGEQLQQVPGRPHDPLRLRQPLSRGRHTPGTNTHQSCASGAMMCRLDISVPDTRVFWPPGSVSGSTSHRYGSGSGSESFYYHANNAKIIRKTLIPTILWLFLTFYLWKII